MAIVSSFGGLRSIDQRSAAPAPATAVAGSLGLYGASSVAYQEIYRSQPNVRTVVDFLARNMAQLSLHSYRRVSDTDRERLVDHDVALWLEFPNPGMCGYRLFESLLCDLGIYFNAFWLKVRLPERLGLVRLPPEQMSVAGGLMPSGYTWLNTDGTTVELLPSEIVHFGGYDPANPIMGFSPLETLRRILAEEAASGAYRQEYWNNSARFSGIIERPRDPAGKPWTDGQKKSWRQQWQEAYGAGGVRVGQVAVLEDGMTFKQMSWSARDSEYVSARKLTREEVAAAYHVPLPMVGILDHATFSNIKEQHKHLYQDTLGPWCKLIQSEVKRQLLPDSSDQDRIYFEFNITEKLKGSFEEQATSLAQLVGRPIMTANEGRARLNLPAIDTDDANSLAPQQGGPATAALPAPMNPQEEQVAAVLQGVWERQRARLDKLTPEARVAGFLAEQARWHTEVRDDLTPLLGAEDAETYAITANAQMLALLKQEADRAA